MCAHAAAVALADASGYEAARLLLLSADASGLDALTSWHAVQRCLTS